jgi:hypothetical protein
MALDVAMNTKTFTFFLRSTNVFGFMIFPTLSMKNQPLTIKVRDQLRYFALPEWFQMTTDIRSIILEELEDMSSSTRLKRTSQ